LWTFAIGCQPSGCGFLRQADKDEAALLGWLSAGAITPDVRFERGR
jgi:hypothetical protein